MLTIGLSRLTCVTLSGSRAITDSSCATWPELAFGAGECVAALLDFASLEADAVGVSTGVSGEISGVSIVVSLVACVESCAREDG